MPASNTVASSAQPDKIAQLNAQLSAKKQSLAQNLKAREQHAAQTRDGQWKQKLWDYDVTIDTLQREIIQIEGTVSVLQNQQEKINALNAQLPAKKESLAQNQQIREQVYQTVMQQAASNSKNLNSYQQMLKGYDATIDSLQRDISQIELEVRLREIEKAKPVELPASQLTPLPNDIDTIVMVPYVDPAQQAAYQRSQTVQKGLIDFAMPIADFWDGGMAGPSSRTAMGIGTDQYLSHMSNGPIQLASTLLGAGIGPVTNGGLVDYLGAAPPQTQWIPTVKPVPPPPPSPSSSSRVDNISQTALVANDQLWNLTQEIKALQESHDNLSSAQASFQSQLSGGNQQQFKSVSEMQGFLQAQSSLSATLKDVYRQLSETDTKLQQRQQELYQLSQSLKLPEIASAGKSGGTAVTQTSATSVNPGANTAASSVQNASQAGTQALSSAAAAVAAQGVTANLSAGISPSGGTGQGMMQSAAQSSQATLSQGAGQAFYGVPDTGVSGPSLSLLHVTETRPLVGQDGSVGMVTVDYSQKRFENVFDLNGNPTGSRPFLPVYDTQGKPTGEWLRLEQGEKTYAVVDASGRRTGKVMNFETPIPFSSEDTYTSRFAIDNATGKLYDPKTGEKVPGLVQGELPWAAPGTKALDLNTGKFVDPYTGKPPVSSSTTSMEPFNEALGLNSFSERNTNRFNDFAKDIQSLPLTDAEDMLYSYIGKELQDINDYESLTMKMDEEAKSSYLWQAAEGRVTDVLKTPVNRKDPKDQSRFSSLDKQLNAIDDLQMQRRDLVEQARQAIKKGDIDTSLEKLNKSNALKINTLYGVSDASQSIGSSQGVGAMLTATNVLSLGLDGISLAEGAVAKSLAQEAANARNAAQGAVHSAGTSGVRTANPPLAKGSVLLPEPKPISGGSVLGEIKPGTLKPDTTMGAGATGSLNAGSGAKSATTPIQGQTQRYLDAQTTLTDALKLEKQATSASDKKAAADLVAEARNNVNQEKAVLDYMQNPNMPADSKTALNGRIEQQSKIANAEAELGRANSLLDSAKKSGRSADIQAAAQLRQEASAKLQSEIGKLDTMFDPLPTTSPSLGSLKPGADVDAPRITSLNTENLGLGSRPPRTGMSQSELTEHFDNYVKNTPGLDNKLESLARELKNTVGPNGEKANIATLQEIDNPEFLDYFTSKYGLKDEGFKNFAFYPGKLGSVGQATLWKDGIRGEMPLTVNVDDSSVARNIGRVTLEFPSGEKLTVYNAHLQSPTGAGNYVKPQQQAALESLAKDIQTVKGSDVFVAGDMNSSGANVSNVLGQAGLQELTPASGSTARGVSNPIDRVFTSGNLFDLAQSTSQLGRFSDSVSDHRPVTTILKPKNPNPASGSTGVRQPLSQAQYSVNDTIPESAVSVESPQGSVSGGFQQSDFQNTQLGGGFPEGAFDNTTLGGGFERTYIGTDQPKVQAPQAPQTSTGGSLLNSLDQMQNPDVNLLHSELAQKQQQMNEYLSLQQAITDPKKRQQIQGIISNLQTEMDGMEKSLLEKLGEKIDFTNPAHAKFDTELQGLQHELTSKQGLLKDLQSTYDMVANEWSQLPRTTQINNTYRGKLMELDQQIQATQENIQKLTDLVKARQDVLTRPPAPENNSEPVRSGNTGAAAPAATSTQPNVVYLPAPAPVSVAPYIPGLGMALGIATSTLPTAPVGGGGYVAPQPIQTGRR